MKIQVIVIGDELLLGEIIDTNSGFLARTVAPMGLAIDKVTTIHDDPAALKEAVKTAMMQADIVLTTGGLGPTKDDRTKQTLVEIFGGQLRYDPNVAQNVARIMAERGRELNELTRTQAIVPTSCRVIQNRLGTAPVMWFEHQGKVLVAMPGVPFETQAVFAEEVFPQLLTRFGYNGVLEHDSLIVCGMSESAIAEAIEPTESTLPDGVNIAYLPNASYVRLRIDSRAAEKGIAIAAINDVKNSVKQLLGSNIVCGGNKPLAATLLDLLRQYGLTMATAESCTGGNIAHAITLIPGSSEAMLGGVVAYSNDVKVRILGVNAATIQANGAVSIPVVSEMAQGVCHAAGAAVGIATSGIAGPGGGSPEKPVGTVCMAVAINNQVVTETRRFHGSRSRVIDQATNHALLIAIKALTGNII